MSFMSSSLQQFSIYYFVQVKMLLMATLNISKNRIQDAEHLNMWF
jgi:hypothetical protein